MIKITVDSCVLMHYWNKQSNFFEKLLDSKLIELFITETVIKEITWEEQKVKLKELIDSNTLTVLKEPKEGFTFPMIFPLNFTLSYPREEAISKYLKLHPKETRQSIHNDFLIAEAHALNKNDYLLTDNTKDFIVNLDIKLIDYKINLSRLIHQHNSLSH